MKCRFCQAELEKVFIDLVNSPPSNSYLSEEELDYPEVYYPLKIFVCDKCYLVQVDEYKKSSEIFDKDYAYFSSFSTSWLEHSKEYVEMVCSEFGLGATSQVIEIASNDGYLLQYFQEKKVPSLGVEPTASTAAVSREKGIETIEEFWGVPLARKLAEDGRSADLILGNNVLAHVPDINDFVAGLKLALKKDGFVTMEFPHLMNLVEFNQFDTIYHEHFSYLSFTTVKKIFEKQGLEMFHVEEIPTHGGSLRIFARHTGAENHPVRPSVEQLLVKEQAKGMNTLDYYSDFQKKADLIKYNLLSFLLQEKRAGKKVAAYGAAAKGNTLLNYCGVKQDLIEYVVDKSPYKQNRFLPGSHVPIVDESFLEKQKPDYLLILPWNIKAEIIEQYGALKDKGVKFVVAIPELTVI